MGNNCSTIQPDTTNMCNVSVDEYQPTPMPNFCTLKGAVGDSFRSEYCSLMSNANEWDTKNPEDFGSCFYNDCNNYQAVNEGCCGLCCAIAGGQLKCKRQSFAGEPGPCCLNDLTCVNVDPSTNPPQCFSDVQKQKTCSDGKNGQPNYRSIVSTDCRDALISYCTGTLSTDNPSSTEWLNRWTVNSGGSGSCAYAVQRNLFNSTDPNQCGPIPIITPGICNIMPPERYDADGYFWAQQLISATIQKYTDQGFMLGSLPGSPGYNTFQNFLYTNICCPYPGLCQDGLQRACASYTSQRISLNPAIAQICGCHLPTGEYQDYSVKYNIPPECTPMCNRADTVPIVGVNAQPVVCTQNICLIDGVTVNIVNSQLGNLNFNQVCGNCPGGQCSCIIADSTVDVLNSTINGTTIPVSENCGNLTCTQTNPGTLGPATLTVPCTPGTPFNPFAEYDAQQLAAQKSAQKSSFTTTLIVIGIGLLLVFLFILFIYPRKYPVSGGTIPNSKSSSPQFLPNTDNYRSINNSSSFTSTNDFSSSSPSTSLPSSTSSFRSINDPYSLTSSTSSFRSINDPY